jgi:flagellar protein FliO/FliZ
MNAMNPRTKIIAASLLLLGLGAAASLGGLHAAGMARALLGLAAVAGFGVWYLRARRVSGPYEAPRLEVVSRTGLAGRTGIALVEVDGQSFLVVHGDGFAQIRPTTRSAP